MARRVQSIEFHVTDIDICNAIPNDPGHCAIAQAIKREYPEATYISVGRDTVSYTIRSQGKRYKHRTSLTAREAQAKLDKGLPVTAADFPTIRLYMDEAIVKDISFTDEVRDAQNLRRLEIRAGTRTVRPMTARQKTARLKKRRHA